LGGGFGRSSLRLSFAALGLLAGQLLRQRHAFDAIAAMLPGSVGCEPEPDANGERLIWLETSVVNRLRALRRPSESYSDVILQLAKTVP
jgi:hypothetical protein